MLFQFKVQIKNIFDPPVWRKLLVPDNFSFHRFHHVIQAAFGWEDCHLYQFSPKGYSSYPIIGIPNLDTEVDDSKKIRLDQIFSTPKQKFVYIYDFGDDWKHDITLEKIVDGTFMHADCIDGKGACPPEDSGGTWGYSNLKRILDNPKDPEHAQWKEWLGMEIGQPWNSETFDLEKTKKAVSKIK